MSTPPISIALCSYNGARHLRAQLDSFARQTLLPAELIINDDGSTDDTLAVAEEFARSAPFAVRIERNERNLGFTQNFARAVSRCSGELIFLSDQDDVWDPTKLARFADRFARGPAPGLVFCDANLVDNDLKPLGQTWWGSRRFDAGARARLEAPGGGKLILKDPTWFAAGATMAFAARFVPLCLPIPAGWGHDGWIATLVGMVAPVGVVAAPLNDYRQHAAQLFGGSAPQVVVNQLAQHRGATPDHFQNTAGRYAVLRERLASRDIRLDPRLARQIAGKIDHWAARARMRRGPKVLRLPTIGREFLAGRYHRYSQGWKSLAMDVLI